MGKMDIEGAEPLALFGARRLLEETTRGIPDVAAACGFGSPETMRIAFRRALGVNPQITIMTLATRLAYGLLGKPAPVDEPEPESIALPRIGRPPTPLDAAAAPALP